MDDTKIIENSCHHLFHGFINGYSQLICVSVNKSVTYNFRFNKNMLRFNALTYKLYYYGKEFTLCKCWDYR